MRRSTWIWIALFAASCASPPPASVPTMVEDPLAGPGVVVLIFVRIDCPISNRYAPAIRELAAEHGARGVRFVMVYADLDATPEAIARHQREFDLPPRVLRDPEHAWVARTGVSVTPEVAVFDAAHRLSYRGRIDDRFPMPGVARDEARVH
ncbi:MAG: redoxin family protein, partial [Planctomycetota bacterium]